MIGFHVGKDSPLNAVIFCFTSFAIIRLFQKFSPGSLAASPNKLDVECLDRNSKECWL